MRKKPKHPSLKKPQNQTNNQTTTTTLSFATPLCKQTEKHQFQKKAQMG
jgi:hypothetical protein